MARASLREIFVPAVLNHACYRRPGAWAGLWNVVGEGKCLQGWKEGLTLIWIVKTSVVTACTGLIWPWIGTSGGCCEHGNEHSGSTMYVRGITVICVWRVWAIGGNRTCPVFVQVCCSHDVPGICTWQICVEYTSCGNAALYTLGFYCCLLSKQWFLTHLIPTLSCIVGWCLLRHTFRNTVCLCACSYPLCSSMYQRMPAIHIPAVCSCVSYRLTYSECQPAYLLDWLWLSAVRTASTRVVPRLRQSVAGLFPAEASVRCQACPCGICGGQSGTCTSFSLSICVSSYQYYSASASYPFSRNRRHTSLATSSAVK